MDFSAFEIAELLRQRSASQEPYLAFLDVPTLSLGVYVLPHDAVDQQSPHDRDEVYYVLSGRAQFQIGEGDSAESQPVQSGSVLFVKAQVPHRFHTITEDLEILVFFASG